MWLVVGLGNPGRRYADTRHNVGYRVVERLAERHGATWRSLRGSAVAQPRPGGTRVGLVKPLSYMNRSGGPVESLRAFYKVSSSQVLVVHDHLDLPLGRIRLRTGGGHGGHNGLRDLKRHLPGDFPRIAVGISRPPPHWDPADYVLSVWRPEERPQVEQVVDRAVEAAEHVLKNGVESAMNAFNATRGAASGHERAEGSPFPESQASTGSGSSPADGEPAGDAPCAGARTRQLNESGP